MNKLEEIFRYKKIEVERKKNELLFSELIELLPTVDTTRDFAESLRHHEPDSISCIAEIKKASPSKGVITTNFSVERIAHEYRMGGAAAISVLTDQKYFHGKDEFVKTAKATVPLPILRKEFIVDEYQIYESRLLGADAILLIVAGLSDSELKNFITVARDLSMSALIECHSKEEIERTLECDGEIIGINNRDLKTFTVEIETSLNLKKFIPNDKLSVSESGIRNYYTVRQLIDAGFDAMLVGEHLMMQSDRKIALQHLFGK